MRVALEVWGADGDQVLATGRRAEQLGFHACYYGESPHGLNLDCWTMLAALARTTTRLRLGPVIANILPTWRSTVLLGRHAATVARLSHGRLDFRTGVGAATSFGRAWWAPVGVDYPGYDQRLADLAHALETLRPLWAGADGAPPPAAPPPGAGTAAPATGTGTLDPVTVPVPGGLGPPVPLTVAATGARAMALAAAYAAVWETSFCTPVEVADRIARMARVAGVRPVTCSLEVDGFVAATPAAVGRLLDRVRTERGRTEDLEPVLARALVGTPPEVAAQIDALARAGVGQLLVALHDPHDPAALEALAAAVALSRRIDRVP